MGEIGAIIQIVKSVTNRIQNSTEIIQILMNPEIKGRDSKINTIFKKMLTLVFSM